MRKILAATVLSLATLGVAQAQHRHNHHHHHHRHNWVAPAIIAGTLGYMIGREAYAQPQLVQPYVAPQYVPQYVPQYTYPQPQQCWESSRYYDHWGRVVSQYTCR